MILHTVNKSPFTQDALRSCLRVVSEEDSVVLLEDGVYAALEDTLVSELIRDVLKKVAVYSLLPDLKARGIEKQVIAGVRLIDYDGFVGLTEKHSVVQSWF